jgi:hypothetical protein
VLNSRVSFWDHCLKLGFVWALTVDGILGFGWTDEWDISGVLVFGLLDGWDIEVWVNDFMRL